MRVDKKAIFEKNPKARWAKNELGSSIAEANPYFKILGPQMLTNSAISSTSIETGITINYDYNSVLANSGLASHPPAKTNKYNNK
jgi:hypothetical protein